MSLQRIIADWVVAWLTPAMEARRAAERRAYREAFEKWERAGEAHFRALRAKERQPAQASDEVSPLAEPMLSTGPRS